MVLQNPGVDYERLFVENLSTIERLARCIASRHRVPHDAREDFASTVKLRLIENGYRVLREFEGRSSLTTYLTIVISRLFLDYRKLAWGRWRPTAKAEALGPDAVLLEQLVVRDGHSLGEALHLMRTRYEVRRPESDLYRLWSALPGRPQARPVPEAMAEAVPSAEATPLERVLASEERALAADALAQAIASLAPGDRLLLQLHFSKGVPLAHVAAALKISKATAHRRLQRALETCRTDLSGAGFTRSRIRALSREGVTDALSSILDDLCETSPRPGRLSLRDE